MFFSPTLALSSLVLGALTVSAEDRRAGAVLAGSFNDNITVTASDVSQCGQASISWTGTTDPVTLYIGIGGFYVGETPITNIPNLSGGSTTWQVNQASGVDLIFRVTDANNKSGYIQNIKVASSDDSSCLADSSTPSSTSSAAAAAAATSSTADAETVENAPSSSDAADDLTASSGAAASASSASVVVVTSTSPGAAAAAGASSSASVVPVIATSTVHASASSSSSTSASRSASAGAANAANTGAANANYVTSKAGVLAAFVIGLGGAAML